MGRYKKHKTRQAQRDRKREKSLKYYYNHRDDVLKKKRNEISESDVSEWIQPDKVTLSFVWYCFSKMNDVYFVNASRGEVIEDESLIRALKRGNVRYAALDVLSGETVNDINSHILVNYARENKNLIITPHCAGSSNDGLEKVFEHAARTLVKNIGE